ncbi:diguanylate cyclase [Labrenzia aggregata]|uniref:Diguanylate cyclase n=2 Tax=Roseibium aggregatum TaxID=187304 RepID=A0A939EA14_9HYPH|nr:diguanylate cyclase [Roseibium aggregatum]
MLLIDPDSGSILDANQAAADFYGIDREKLRTMPIQDINQFTPDQVKAERQLAKQENRNFFIFRHKLSDGSIRTVEVHSTPVDYNGRLALLSIVHDISEDRERQEELRHYRFRLEELVDQKTAELSAAYKAGNYWMLGLIGTLGAFLALLSYLLLERYLAHKRLLQAEQRQREILFGTNVGTWEWNVQTGEAVFNQKWAEMLGFSLGELEPTSVETWHDRAHPDDLKQSREKLEEVFSGETDHYDCEVRMRHKNGKWVWVLDRGRVVEWTKDGKPLRMSGTHSDITRLKTSEEKVRQLAMTDYLTGLSNRAHFSQCLEQNVEIARLEGRKFALIVMDLDRFKPVNDSFGHPVGDDLLRVVAATIRKCTRHDDIVSRLGGDEFAIIITDYTDEKDALVCAERISDEISKPLEVMGNEVKIGVSIGIACYPDDADTAEALIKNADLAMYRAKKSSTKVAS